VSGRASPTQIWLPAFGFYLAFRFYLAQLLPLHAMRGGDFFLFSILVTMN
jgi:hypothetical protein